MLPRGLELGAWGAVSALVLALLLTLVSGIQPLVGSIPDELRARVKKVIDGDTILLENGDKVRLIGIDTPELYHPAKPVQYFAREASDFTRILVEGKAVRLEFDWQKRDKYERLLAYVYILDRDVFVNAEIIRQGYGFAYTKYPFKYLEDFRELEREARENEIGLWKGGGKTEFDWLIAEARQPLEVYNMANNLWAVTYRQFVKTRLNDEQLLAALKNARIWIYQFNEKDLEKQLLEDGWEKK